MLKYRAPGYNMAEQSGKRSGRQCISALCNGVSIAGPASSKVEQIGGGAGVCSCRCSVVHDQMHVHHRQHPSVAGNQLGSLLDYHAQGYSMHRHQ